MSQFDLLKERRFAGMFWTQSIGAFSDTFFKNVLTFLVTYQGFKLAGFEGEEVNYVAAALFMAPFFLFSATAGQLADKLQKHKMIRHLKALEIAFALLALLGLHLHNVPLLLIVLVFFAMQATFFGPIKYGILPQLLKDEELVGGNALVETSTNVFILLGTLSGGYLAVSHPPEQLGVILLIISVIGFFACLTIPSAPASEPALKVEWNPLTPTLKVFHLIRERRSVWNAILGISWFWVLGTCILSALPFYTKDVLHAGPGVNILLYAIFSVGVGMGSVLCEKFSYGKLELGLVPLGSIGVCIFCFDFFLAGEPWAAEAQPIAIGVFLQRLGGWRTVIDLFMLSTFSGFFIVPLYTLIQQRGRPEARSRIIAGNNIVNSFFMVGATIGQMLLRKYCTIPQIFAVLAVLNGLVSIYIYTLVREFFLRFLAFLLAHVSYRMKVTGAEKVPETGPVVVVCNHVTLVDWMFLLAALKRPGHFVMWYTYANMRFLRYLFKDAGVIPISSASIRPKILERAFSKIAEYLSDGKMVILFPEGGLTKDGELRSFRPGVEKIIRESPVPVVPCALRGLWGSRWSRYSGPRNRPFIRSRMEVVFGDPIPPEEVTAERLQALVNELRGPHR